jgi:hypothetical protein
MEDREQRQPPFERLQPQKRMLAEEGPRLSNILNVFSSLSEPCLEPGWETQAKRKPLQDAI